MTAEQFVYWLQGYAELNDAPPSAEQWQAIRDHLALVFNKVTPAVRMPGVYAQPHTWSPTSAPNDGWHHTVTCSLPGNDTAARLVC